MDEVRRTLGRGCEACHRLNAEMSAFEPMSFEQHCATCHLADGVLPVITDPIPETLVSAPSRSSGLAPGADGVRRPGRGTIVVSGLAHRDPWVVQNLRTLARGVYGPADVAERQALEARVGALNRARSASLAGLDTAELAQRLASVDVSSPDAARLRDRISLEIERRATGTPSRTSLAEALSEDRAIESALVAARARLDALADRTSVPIVGTDERARRLDAILSLAGPCLTCHVLQNGIEFAAVNVDMRRMPRAQFTHAPHVIQAECDTCHTSIATSTASTDRNTPGIATCQTCHSTGKAPSGCTVCHRYHASSDAGFARPSFGVK
jgi:hypothetical protein